MIETLALWIVDQYRPSATLIDLENLVSGDQDFVLRRIAGQFGLARQRYVEFAGRVERHSVRNRGKILGVNFGPAEAAVLFDRDPQTVVSRRLEHVDRLLLRIDRGAVGDIKAG